MDEPKNPERRPGDASEAAPRPALRRERRADLNVPVRISTIDAERDPRSGRPFFRASREVCSNVSRNGLFIRTAEPFEPGRRLLLEVELPGGDEVEAVGRVAWVKKSLAPGEERGVGVELVGGTPDQLATLQGLVAGKRRRGDDPSSVG